MTRPTVHEYAGEVAALAHERYSLADRLSL
jgi:hypothetical protein